MNRQDYKNGKKGRTKRTRETWSSEAKAETAGKGRSFTCVRAKEWTRHATSSSVSAIRVSSDENGLIKGVMEERGVKNIGDPDEV